eukprot:2007379-Rhodomonas_salina.2
MMTRCFSCWSGAAAQQCEITLGVVERVRDRVSAARVLATDGDGGINVCRAFPVLGPPALIPALAAVLLRWHRARALFRAREAGGRGRRGVCGLPV